MIPDYISNWGASFSLRAGFKVGEVLKGHLGVMEEAKGRKMDAPNTSVF